VFQKGFSKIAEEYSMIAPAKWVIRDPYRGLAWRNETDLDPIAPFPSPEPHGHSNRRRLYGLKTLRWFDRHIVTSQDKFYASPMSRTTRKWLSPK
jgi:hypothetical protein